MCVNEPGCSNRQSACARDEAPIRAGVKHALWQVYGTALQPSPSHHRRAPLERGDVGGHLAPSADRRLASSLSALTPTLGWRRAWRVGSRSARNRRDKAARTRRRRPPLPTVSSASVTAPPCRTDAERARTHRLIRVLSRLCLRLHGPISVAAPPGPARPTPILNLRTAGRLDR